MQRSFQKPYLGLIRRYREFLPIAESAIVTLLEGNTPLIEAGRLKTYLNLPCPLFLKFEGLNPTASFKDRGMTYAVSKAVEAGAKTLICASTGNTSASAAAYAARANLQCVVLIPEGKIAYGKLSQAMIYGAKVVQVRGNFDEALNLVRELSEKYPIHLVNSVNPHRLEGQKTAAFEICEYLDGPPSHHFLPVGNAGNITAHWMGYKQWHDLGVISSKPKMMGFQAAGAAPIVDGRIVRDPQTLATAIRIGNPASWNAALQARDQSHGRIDKVTDAQIVEAYKLLSQLEGIFCEPASAASVAGVVALASQNYFTSDDLLVCTLTGHGLKDPDTAISNSVKPNTLDADMQKIAKYLGY